MTLSAVTSPSELAPLDSRLNLSIPGMTVSIEVDPHDAAEYAADQLYRILMMVFTGIHAALHENYQEHQKAISTAKWYYECAKYEVKFSYGCFLATANFRRHKALNFVSSLCLNGFKEGWKKIKPFASYSRKFIFGEVHFSK